MSWKRWKRGARASSASADSCNYGVRYGSMRTAIVRIGNSQGVRLPKLLLEAAGITSRTVTVTAEKGRIVIAPDEHPRQRWAEAIDAAGEDSTALDPYVPTVFDETEWTWPETDWDAPE